MSRNTLITILVVVVLLLVLWFAFGGDGADEAVVDEGEVGEAEVEVEGD